MIGRTFAHFEVTRKLGSGGMGTVYEARDQRLGRTVALKLLDLQGEAAVHAPERLMREARAASQIDHPNVCTVFEVGEADGQPFIAMELVRGHTLAEHLARGPLAPAELSRWAVQIAEALAHAHARGIVHRDLKSANVIVIPDGRVKVLDFGLARLEHEEAAAPADYLRLTSAGMMVGTPYVIAPEVLRGAVGDARSDVWSFGVMLYEMAAGRLPFEGRTVPEIAAAVLREPPPPLPPSVPAPLARLIARSLDKDPARRPTAAEMAEALRALEQRGGGRASGVRVGRPALAAGFALLGLGAAIAVDLGGWRSRAMEALGVTPRIRSIAVLPLDNLSRDPAQDYLADGLTEGLIAELAQIGALRVISRTSVMAYRDSPKSMKRIAEELDVDALIEGSVQRSGDRVRVTAQLIDGRRDRHLWAQAYDRPFKDVLALQDDVAGDIAGRIRVEVTPAERSRLRARREGRPEVLELVMKGRYHQNRLTPEGMRAAIELYRRAIEIDPDDARPWSGLADAYTILAEVLGALPFEEAWPRVRENAARALELDESLPEAHTSMGAVLWLADWDWPAAEREMRRAVELNPGYALGHDVLGLLLISRGRVDEGLTHTRRALELDPLSIFTASNAVFAHYLARRYDEGLVLARKAIELEPRLGRPWRQTARLHELRGDLSAALTAWEAAARVDTGLARGVAAMRPGLAREGERGYWSAQLAFPRGDESAVLMPAMLEGRLGRNDRAFAELERALQRRDGDLPFLEMDPGFDPLRSDPRFAAFLRRIGPGN